MKFKQMIMDKTTAESGLLLRKYYRIEQNRIKQVIRVRQDLNANTSLPQLLVLLLQRLDTHSISLNLHLEHAILLKQRINALLELLSRCRHIRGTTTIRHHHGHMVMSTASCHALIYRARITL